MKRGAIKRQKKKKREEKRNLFFAPFAWGERTAFYLKRLFFYSRTYMSITKEWEGFRMILVGTDYTLCTVLIHTYHERRMSLLLYIYVHTCARYVYARTHTHTRGERLICAREHVYTCVAKDRYAKHTRARHTYTRNTPTFPRCSRCACMCAYV